MRLAENHGTVVYREMLSDLQFGFPDRDLRAYVTVQNGTQHFALDSVIDAARARVLTVTLGANHRAGDRVLWGAALTLGTHDNEAAAVRLDTRGAIGSLHAAVRAGNAYVHGAVSGGVADVAIGRDITIGQPAASGFFAAATAPTPGCSPVWPSSTCSPSTTGCSPRCATPSGAT